MNFKLLTINNITKICDDNLYFSPDNKLTQYQWYDFQLEFALKNLETNLEDYLVHKLTNYKRTRSEILEVIYQIYGTNKIFTKEGIKSDVLKKYGLLKGEGIKDYYLPQTLGGISELIYDDAKDIIKIPKTYEKATKGSISDSVTDLSSLNAPSTILPKKRIKIPRKPKSKKSSSSDTSSVASTASSSSKASNSSKKRFKIPNPKKSSSSDTSSVASAISSSSKASTSTEKSQSRKLKIRPKGFDDINLVRKAKGLRVINESNDMCRKLGKFDWNRNSCYADSVLLGLIYTAIFNKPSAENPIGSLVYNTIMNKSYTSDEIGITLPLCSGKNKAESASAINNIIVNLREIVNKIESGEIINIREFTKKVKSTCSNLFTENFHGSGTHDTKDFHNNIMLILGLDSTSSNIENFYFFDYNTALTMLDEPFVKNPYDRSQLRVQDGEGNNLLKATSQNSNNSPILTIEVRPDYLYIKYRNLDVEGATSQEVKANRGNYVKMKVLGKYIKKDKVGILMNRLSSISFDIEDFLNTRDSQFFTDDDNIAYKYFNPNIEDQLYLGERYYFNKEDRGNYENYLKSRQVPDDVGFRMGLKIQELIADNSSYYINFNINRLHIVSSLVTHRIQQIKLNVKVNLKEELLINGTEYNLNYIVCHFGVHYVSIYRCDNKYYLYDDMLADSNDYVKDIGNFESLKTFKYKNMEEFALRNSVFISYSK